MAAFLYVVSCRCVRSDGICLINMIGKSDPGEFLDRLLKVRKTDKRYQEWVLLDSIAISEEGYQALRKSGLECLEDSENTPSGVSAETTISELERAAAEAERENCALIVERYATSIRANYDERSALEGAAKCIRNMGKK